MWRRILTQHLKNDYEKARQSEPSVTLRSYAQRLGFSHGAFSEYLTGRRALTAKAGYRLLNGLELTTQQRRDIERMMIAESKAERVLLAEDAYELISKWYYTPILCLFELDHPPESVESVAERLGINLDRANEAVQVLIGHKLLERDHEGRLRSAAAYWTTEDGAQGPTALAIRESHRNDLSLAKRALARIPADSRDFTSMTFAGSKERMEQARAEIRRFRDRIVELMDSSSADQVYKLTIQLFPLDGWGIGNDEH